MSKVFEGSISGAGLRLGIVASRWNDFIVEPLIASARDALKRSGVEEARIDVAMVPGAYEIPFAAKLMAEAGRYDALVALGCVIRGETAHFDYVAGEAARGLADVARQTGVPIGFGVLAVENAGQAADRAGGKFGNKGAEAALAAIEMAGLCRAVREA